MKEKMAAIRGFFAAEKRRRTLAVIAVALVLALIAWLCISIGMRANIQRRYEAVRNAIGEDLYANLNLMMQTFDMTSVPTADVRNAILPQMKQLFYAATALNDLLGQAYSPKYRVMTDGDVSAIENAFSSYEAAFNDSASTDLAQSNMMACMARVKELLDTRYVNGVLRALR